MNYQPVVDLRTGKVVGAESLVRWRRRLTGEVVRPEVFIRAAEDSGLMPRLTEIVIETVVEDAARVHAAQPDFTLGINFSPEDIKTTKAASKLIQMAKERGIDPKRFVVEITETGLLAEEQFESVRMLREAGVAVAMDDFGTGYSSMATLMKLEVDCLKVDRIFVESIGKNSVTSQVVDHMIDMAQSLKLAVVAEGVETQEQAEYLRSCGVDHAQGFYFGRPVGIEDLLSSLWARSE